jgi:hypothetical protein
LIADAAGKFADAVPPDVALTRVGHPPVALRGCARGEDWVAPFRVQPA